MARFIGVFPARRGDPGWWAAWAEFGTAERTVTSTGKPSGRMPATPFLLPAFHSLRRRAAGRVKRAVNRAIKGAARRG